MAHARTHKLAKETKEKRLKKKIKEKQAKDKARISWMREILNGHVWAMRKLIDNLDLVPWNDSGGLHQLTYHAEHDPRFTSEDWKQHRG